MNRTLIFKSAHKAFKANLFHSFSECLKKSYEAYKAVEKKDMKHVYKELKRLARIKKNKNIQIKYIYCYSISLAVTLLLYFSLFLMKYFI